MAKLYRPHIPIEVKCRVVLRQLGEMFPDEVLNERRRHHRGFGPFLKQKRQELADLLGCEVSDLRLDHDPPLGARVKHDYHKGDDMIGMTYFSVYEPDANDPEYLRYRPHGAQFAGSHDVKTRIRGDHGQFSDITLIKRQRRRERGPKPKRPFASVSGLKVRSQKRKPSKTSAKKARRLALTKPKTNWPKRRFPNRRKP